MGDAIRLSLGHMHQTRVSLPPLSLNAWMRYDFIERILDRAEGINTVLEVGAGQGAIGTRLASRYVYTGVEPDPISFRRAEERLRRLGRGRIVNGYVSDLAGDERFDLLCAFEVLEHIEDDVAALSEWGERVRPGGYVVISSPAFPEHWGPFDRFAGHFRRYDRAGFVGLLEAAGFERPSVFTYGFGLGQVLEKLRDALVARRQPGPIEQQTAASGRWMHPTDRIGVLTMVASAPFRLLQRPFARSDIGTGFVAVARRPGPD